MFLLIRSGVKGRTEQAALIGGHDLLQDHPRIAAQGQQLGKELRVFDVLYRPDLPLNT